MASTQSDAERAVKVTLPGAAGYEPMSVGSVTDELVHHSRENLKMMGGAKTEL